MKNPPAEPFGPNVFLQGTAAIYDGDKLLALVVKITTPSAAQWRPITPLQLSDVRNFRLWCLESCLPFSAGHRELMELAKRLLAEAPPVALRELGTRYAIVQVDVRGGVAYAATVPDGIKLTIRDYDNGAQSDDPDLPKDEDGDPYTEDITEGPVITP